MTGRLRRTRIYGANYNIGESYYKPTLDSLNRKQRGGSKIKDDLELLGKEIPSHSLNDDFANPKSILQRAMTEEPPSVFNYRNRERDETSAALLNDDFDEEVQNTLKKIRGLKKMTTNYLEDSSLATGEKHMSRGLDIVRKVKPLYDSDEDLPVMRKAMGDIMQSATSTVSASSARANATKERLANIESEMSERFDKQVQRDSRSAHLKKFMCETGVETKVVKKVTF